MSFPQKRESTLNVFSWIPASAGMTLYSFFSKSVLLTPHTGHTQSSGKSSKDVPGSIPESDSVTTHINLNDNTIEGIVSEKLKAFSVQYHPESYPGPQDSDYLFDRFVKMVKEGKERY